MLLSAGLLLVLSLLLLAAHNLVLSLVAFMSLALVGFWCECDLAAFVGLVWQLKCLMELGSFVFAEFVADATGHVSLALHAAARAGLPFAAEWSVAQQQLLCGCWLIDQSLCSSTGCAGNANPVACRQGLLWLSLLPDDLQASLQHLAALISQEQSHCALLDRCCHSGAGLLLLGEALVALLDLVLANDDGLCVPQQQKSGSSLVALCGLCHNQSACLGPDCHQW